jgi:hypothetical protein
MKQLAAAAIAVFFVGAFGSGAMARSGAGHALSSTATTTGSAGNGSSGGSSGSNGLLNGSQTYYGLGAFASNPLYAETLAQQHLLYPGLVYPGFPGYIGRQPWFNGGFNGGGPGPSGPWVNAGGTGRPGTAINAGSPSGANPWMNAGGTGRSGSESNIGGASGSNPWMNSGVANPSTASGSDPWMNP